MALKKTLNKWFQYIIQGSEFLLKHYPDINSIKGARTIINIIDSESEEEISTLLASPASLQGEK